MPRNIHNGDLDMSLTVTSPLTQGRLQGDGYFSQETSRKVLPANKTPRKTKAQLHENSFIKLPVLTRSRKTYKEENKNLQVLLRGIQCFNLTYQNLLPEMPHKSSQTESSATRDSHVCLPDDSRDITQENGPNCDQSREESVPIDKDVEKEKDNFLPLVCSILEGQRLKIRQKEGFQAKRSKQLKCKSTEKEKKPPCQAGSTSEDSDIESVLKRSTPTDSETFSSSIPGVTEHVKPSKGNARPVFHLPRADKYDITPRNIINSKTCAVFKESHKQSLFKSSYKDSWIPRKDSSFIRNSAFKAIIQQPVVFLRQPSPVAGVKMTLLKEHEATIAAAIQTVKKRNVQTPSVDAEVSPHIKKFVIRLPPIC